MNAVHKIMEILDDNAQQVPEGFYLEVCNQLKNLHKNLRLIIYIIIIYIIITNIWNTT